MSTRAKNSNSLTLIYAVRRQAEEGAALGALVGRQHVRLELQIEAEAVAAISMVAQKCHHRLRHQDDAA